MAGGPACEEDMWKSAGFTGQVILYQPRKRTTGLHVILRATKSTEAQ